MSASSAKVTARKGAGAANAAQPFSFAARAAQARVAPGGMERVNERLARRLRRILEPFAGGRIAIVQREVEQLSLAAWQARQPDFAALTLYGVQPGNGSALIAVDPAGVVRLVDAYYGGKGLPPDRPPAELSPTEDRLAVKLVQAIEAAIVEVWGEIAPIQLHQRSRESNVGFATIAAPDDTVIASPFLLDFGDGSPSMVEILFPLATLLPLDAKLSADARADQSGASRAWRQRMVAALGEVEVEARTVIAEQLVALADVARLAPGDVIPINLTSRVALRVGEALVGHATLGERAGMVALSFDLPPS